MATDATKEDTHPKLLIRGECGKVPDSYPKDASGQLERDQQFINELTKQLVAESRVACQLNTSLGAKHKSSDTKTDLMYKRAFLLVAGACVVGFSRYYILLCLFGVPKVERINMLLYWPHPNALVAMESISICASACSGLHTACTSLLALSAWSGYPFCPRPN